MSKFRYYYAAFFCKTSFPAYFPTFFHRRFQRRFENAPFPNIFLPRKIFQRCFPKKFRKWASFPRKRNLPKIFLRSFKNVAPGSQHVTLCEIVLLLLAASKSCYANAQPADALIYILQGLWIFNSNWRRESTDYTHSIGFVLKTKTHKITTTIMTLWRGKNILTSRLCYSLDIMWVRLRSHRQECKSEYLYRVPVNTSLHVFQWRPFTMIRVLCEYGLPVNFTRTSSFCAGRVFIPPV